MINDYSKLSFEEQRKIDQKAYSRYYGDFFKDYHKPAYIDDFLIDEDAVSAREFVSNLLSFNSWYGTSLHEKYVQIYLRKQKLQKIEKADI